MNVRSLTTALSAFAVALGAGEFISAVIIWRENYADAQPAFAVAFGVLFLLGAALLGRGRAMAGTVLVSILALVEVTTFPGWTRHNAIDWSSQIATVAVALATLGVAVSLVVTRRRSTPGAILKAGH
jgi:hypothetical protein